MVKGFNQYEKQLIKNQSHGAPISDPARFCWNFNTRRAGGRRSGASVRRRGLTSEI
jgi:hypothetical protein